MEFMRVSRNGGFVIILAFGLNFRNGYHMFDSKPSQVLTQLSHEGAIMGCDVCVTIGKDSHESA